ncbi:hypothetical protein ACPPVO_30925 [Dactylosporangium sp. McL0621]|uniref:hypothetical protein n=1 Tax=Dactylosporangium sp. McL0621 TaxID=3415678 RepID=UPI003CE861DD
MKLSVQSITLMIAGGVLILIGLGASVGLLKSRFSMVVAMTVGLILLAVGLGLAIRPRVQQHTQPAPAVSAAAGSPARPYYGILQ